MQTDYKETLNDQKEAQNVNRDINDNKKMQNT